PAGNQLPQFTAGAPIRGRGPEGPLRQNSPCNDPAPRGPPHNAGQRGGGGPGGPKKIIQRGEKGDGVLVTPPVNDFALPPRAQDFLFIAGGIGVTPMMAMIRQVMAEGKRFRLFYCSRSPETTAFREELSAQQFRDMVTIHYDGGDVSRSLD